MAAPHVAGAWAILKQAYPGAPVGDALTVLRGTGRLVVDGRNGVSTPRIDVGAALRHYASWVCRATGAGYWHASADGGVFTYGDAGFFGSSAGQALNAPVVGMAARAGNDGYWLTAADGGVFNHGSAGFHGAASQYVLNQPVVGIATRPQGDGYWQAGTDGGVFSFGAVPFYGSLPGIGVNGKSNVVGMAARPSGDGYWIVDSSGAIFAFGAAPYLGGVNSSNPGHPDPIVGMAPTISGGGYWITDAKGRVFAFGNAAQHGGTGGTPLAQPIRATAGTSGAGYWLAAGDGGTFSFGDARFCGSAAGGPPLNATVRGAAATHWTTTTVPTTNHAPTGVLDRVGGGRLVGWSYDPNVANAAIATHVYIDGAGYDLGPSSAPRPDVNAARGITGIHGFDWAPPPQWHDGQAHTVNVYAIDSAGGPNPLLGSGSFTGTNYAPVGTVEHADATRASGWAYDPNDPARSTNVEIRIDGNLQTVTADRQRDDIAPAGFHGFHWAVPAQWRDGQAHTLSVHAVDPFSGPSTLLHSSTFNSGTSTTLFSEDWSGVDGAAWDNSKWITTANDSTKTAEVEGGEGRLHVNGASARATAQMATVADSEVTFSYRFSDRAAQSHLRLTLRGAGASGANQLPDGYRLNVRSDSPTIKLEKIVAGTVTWLADLPHTQTTTTQRLRFQVQGSTIRAKAWDATSSEPSAWSATVTDTTITAPGTLQIAHGHNIGARSVHLDNLTITTPEP